MGHLVGFLGIVLLGCAPEPNYAQSFGVTYLFDEWYQNPPFFPELDTLKKYHMRELTMHVSDQLTAESPMESYIYRFDKRYRLLFCEARQTVGDKNYMRTWFQYDRKGRVKKMKLEQVDEGVTFSCSYKYTYAPLENGLTNVSRSKHVDSETSISIDSAYVKWDKSGRVVERVDFWSTTPQRSSYEYTSESDTTIIRTIQYDTPSYYLSGEKYNREVEYRTVHNAKKQLLFIEHRYIKFQTDCGVGMPLFETIEYDSLGRISNHLYTAVGLSYSKQYAYPQPSEYIILGREGYCDLKPLAHYWCNYPAQSMRIVDESNAQTILLNWKSRGHFIERLHFGGI
jgi:hypothetical protein